MTLFAYLNKHCISAEDCPTEANSLNNLGLYETCLMYLVSSISVLNIDFF
jgi:hypothetical protein